MIRRNIYIVVLLFLFLAFSRLLHIVDFWGFAGLSTPQGFEAIGLLFFATLFVLQNGLFGPYLRVVEEREAQTTEKKKLAEKTRLEAEERIARYHRAIDEARLRALRERETRAIQAEEEEQKLLMKAKAEGNEKVRAAVRRLEEEVKRTWEDLHGSSGSVPQLVSEIVDQVMAGGKKGTATRSGIEMSSPE